MCVCDCALVIYIMFGSVCISHIVISVLLSHATTWNDTKMCNYNKCLVSQKSGKPLHQRNFSGCVFFALVKKQNKLSKITLSIQEFQQKLCAAVPHLRCIKMATVTMDVQIFSLRYIISSIQTMILNDFDEAFCMIDFLLFMVW